MHFSEQGSDEEVFRVVLEPFSVNELSFFEACYD
jgi:hypothetical protein